MIDLEHRHSAPFITMKNGSEWKRMGKKESIIWIIRTVWSDLNRSFGDIISILSQWTFQSHFIILTRKMAIYVQLLVQMFVLSIKQFVIDESARKIKNGKWWHTKSLQTFNVAEKRWRTSHHPQFMNEILLFVTRKFMSLFCTLMPITLMISWHLFLLCDQKKNNSHILNDCVILQMNFPFQLW